MLRRAGLLAALTALLVPAVAGTTANAKTRAPVVRSITPKNVFVGQTLTIRGHHFRRGLNKNTVAFKRRGARVMFVKAEKGTTKMLKVTLPKRLEKLLFVKNGTPTPTRLQVRVLANNKFGKRFTSRKNSPIVGAEKPPAPPKPPTADPNADCDGDHVPNRLDTDDDNDLMSDTLEKSLKLDECNADSDRDGVEDGYEYQSAIDLNDDNYQHPARSVPYPDTRPYPNPLDGTDADVDHDGDTLTLMDEYKLWKYTIKSGGPRTLNLSYSAGDQNSLGKLPAATYNKHQDFLSWATAAGYRTVDLVNISGLTLAPSYQNMLVGMPNRYSATANYFIDDLNRSGGVDPSEATYFDESGDGYVNDAERDEDADGLSNQWEATGCMTQSYWNGLYDKESPYYLKWDRADFRLDNGDSDGDGIRDGADDEDHDDIPNVMECSRAAAAVGAPADSWQGFVNPFNPCLPHPASRSCNQHPQVGPGAKKWAPYNETEYPNYYLIKN
jgi:IPT/TIG domain-containing protein